MKVLVVLILLMDPVVLPLTPGLTCSEHGDAWIEVNATYFTQEESRNTDQGWYTPEGHLVYGYYCD